jgi:hypothetical protein
MKKRRPGPRGGDYRVVSRTSVLIETATAALPTALQLYADCETSFSSDENGDLVRVDVRARKTNREIFRNIDRVDIDRQSWRWEGRPVALPPDLQASAAGPVERQRWLAREFGERPDDNHLTCAMPSESDESSGPRGCRRFTYAHALGAATAGGPRPTLHDHRGQHLRFSFHAHSRYAALMPKPAEGQVTGSTTTDGFQTRWHEVFVPSRRALPLPPPRVKLILPLTSDASNQHGPGLLVVLDEPWFEEGGLGEGLVAELNKVESPWASGGVSSADRYYIEFGSDPILWRYDGPQKGDAPSFPSFDINSYERRETTGILGPTGHYVDRDNRAAFFGSTSFQIPALPGAGGGAAAWHLAHVRFRRTLVRRERGAGPARYSPDQWRLRTDVSDPTLPYWVQYLPDFSMSDTFRNVGGLTPIVDVARKRLELRAAGTAAHLTATHADARAFSLYAVLTQVAFDAASRANGEIYVATFKQEDNGVGWVTDESLSGFAIAQNSARARVRLIEVMAPLARPENGSRECWSGPAKPSDIWRELFPRRRDLAGGLSMRCDALARMVRVSEPLPRRDPDSN